MYIFIIKSIFYFSTIIYISIHICIILYVNSLVRIIKTVYSRKYITHQFVWCAKSNVCITANPNGNTQMKRMTVVVRHAHTKATIYSFCAVCGGARRRATSHKRSIHTHTHKCLGAIVDSFCVAATGTQLRASDKVLACAH